MTDTTTASGTAVRDASVAILGQLARTLGTITDEQYAKQGPAGASIGAHVRHTLAHYRKLADGHAENATVAYDQRVRGCEIETKRPAAIAEADTLASTIAGLDETQLGAPITIRAMIAGDGREAEMDSTLVRELWFASHHAIHHNALIKPVADAIGVELPHEFGRAPSTVNNDNA